MDGKQSKIQPSESLPLTDRIYRHGLNDWIEKKGNENIPKFIFFELTEIDKKTGYSLSVDWELQTTPEETIARIGGSYKTNTAQFKEYKNRVIFALDIKFLNSLDFVIDVNYNPIIYPVRKIGFPNNISHSLIKIDKAEYDNKQNRAERLTEMRNHAKDKKIEFKMQKVDKLVAELRKK